MYLNMLFSLGYLFYADRILYNIKHFNVNNYNELYGYIFLTLFCCFCSGIALYMIYILDYKRKNILLEALRSVSMK